MLARWSRLRPRERWQLPALMLVLPFMRLLLACAGFVRSFRWLERWSRPEATRLADVGEIAAAERLATLAEIAGRRGPVRATCLPQALLVHALLRRRGLSPRFRIGVRKRGPAFDAHAWVELEGVALAQKGEAHMPLPREDWARAASTTR
jgi:hypothetical protein